MRGLKSHILVLIAAAGVCLGGRAAFAVDYGVREPEGAWPAVVALARTWGEDRPDPYRIFCSGVVIHPLWVLTAAHCVQEGQVRPSASELRALARSIRVHFGSGSDTKYVSAGLAEVERIRIHSRYMREIRGWSDVALIKLKRPAPVAKADIPPLLLDIATLKKKLLPNVLLKLVGFGFAAQANGPEIFGAKHSGELRIEGKTANEIQIVGGLGRNILEVMAARDGDSGGPIFYRDETGRFHVAGTVSRATQHNHGPFGSVFSLVREHICWLEMETGEDLRGGNGGPDYCAQDPAAPFPSALEGAGFADLCRESERLPVSAQHTIRTLADLYEERDCGVLAEKLEKAINIRLDAAFLTDPRPLARVRALEHLSLRDNDIHSVAALARSEALRFLDISYNNVRELGGIDALASSGRVWLVGRARQDWNMGRTEFIRACSAGDAAPEGPRRTIAAVFQALEMPATACVNANYELIRVRRLEFYRAKGLTDMSPLAGLHALDQLDLSGQAVVDLGFLRAFEDLDRLVLDGNPARDLAPLATLRNLRELSLEKMGLTDISFALGLKRLETLRIGGNRIRDLAVVEALEKQGVKVEGKDLQIID